MIFSWTPARFKPIVFSIDNLLRRSQLTAAEWNTTILPKPALCPHLDIRMTVAVNPHHDRYRRVCGYDNCFSTAGSLVTIEGDQQAYSGSGFDPPDNIQRQGPGRLDRPPGLFNVLDGPAVYVGAGHANRQRV